MLTNNNQKKVLFYLVCFVINHSLHYRNGLGCCLSHLISFLFSRLCFHPFIIEVSTAHFFHVQLLNNTIFLLDFLFHSGNVLLQLLDLLQQFGNFLHKFLPSYSGHLIVSVFMRFVESGEEIELIGVLIIIVRFVEQLLLFGNLVLPEFLIILVLDVAVC